MLRKLYISIASSVFLSIPVLAAGTPEEPGILDNPLQVIMITLMALMLIVIGLLANVLYGTADFKRTEEKAKANGSKSSGAAALTILLLLFSSSLFAQDNTTTAAVSTSIGGMSKTMFYTMTSVLFLELFVIVALLINIKFLIKAEKEKLAAAQAERKQRMLNWWDRFNRFKSIEQEADIDLGHDYDGIRELNNRLPPWWLYGFYLTIIIGGIYLWRFHVSHTGPTSKEEFETAVAQADIKIQQYLKSKGESVDENTVTLLTKAEDLAEGKQMFVKSCASCHKADGAGDVGPNLTDDYWLHGNDVKSIFKTIRYGINAMPQWQNSYSNKQIAQLTSFVKSIHGTNPPGGKAPQGEMAKEEAAATTAVVDSTAKPVGK
jgi:cytochrome c oxidase cbb3-type subunit III